MLGSMTGNFIAAIFFLLFQLGGILIALHILQNESICFKILVGSVMGNFALHWLPCILAIVFGFNIASNLFGLAIFLFLCLLICNTIPYDKSIWRMEHTKIWIFIIPIFIIFLYILHTHTLLIKQGAMYTGQSTFGDMNLHLGIITSIAVQGTFPPEYSIYPGAKLSYPFLSDSISSSLYVFGASLRFAYILPMIFAALQLFYGFYMFAFQWLKRQSSAILAWILLFLNGGFGIVYFINGLSHNLGGFTRMFTEFYTTPTNLATSNIRWVNIIVDMLIPQRATLFGYALLFSILCLLYKAVFEKNKKYYAISAILISGLPMIHTHSFLVAIIVSAVWCLISLCNINYENECTMINNKKIIIILSLAFIIGMELINVHKEKLDESTLMMYPLSLLCILIMVGLYFLFMQIKKGNLKDILLTWGIFLLIMVIPVSWQMFSWTLKQATESHFIKGHFNWSNEYNSYLWFYIKNIGIVALFILPAMLKCKKRWIVIFSPALLLWFIAEFIVFQPNPYDNNKLLYPAYGFMCCVVAAYINDIIKKSQKILSKIIILTIILICSSCSAIFTIIREVNSEYELYSNEQIKLSQYIEEMAPPNAIILTDYRHNNAIACLTGRNILCGTGAFLYYHGIDYADRYEDVYFIYQDVYEFKHLVAKYKIDYILVGPEEKNTFPNLNEDLIRQYYPCVYQTDHTSLYAINR